MSGDTDTITQFKIAAERFAQEQGSVERLRTLFDTRHGIDRDLWRQLAQLGYLGTIVPADQGGTDLGYGAYSQLVRVLSRTLATVGFVNHAMAVELFRSAERCDVEMVHRIIAGETIVTIAWQESHRFGEDRISTAAVQVAGGYEIEGRKQFVLDGGEADGLLLIARVPSENTLGIFYVSKETPGLTLQSGRLLDGRRAAHVDIHVRLSQDCRLRLRRSSKEVLQRAFDRGLIVVSSECLGATEALFDLVLAYLKEREQFGRKIGSFQALQHRMALLFIELELTRAAFDQAVAQLDDNQTLPTIGSLLKHRASRLFRNMASEGIQLIGGIAMTAEFDVGLYYKRAQVLDQLYGDSGYHRQRYLSLNLTR